ACGRCTGPAGSEPRPAGGEPSPGGCPPPRTCHRARARIQRVTRSDRRWRPPLAWRAARVSGRVVGVAVARMRVSGDVPDALRGGPLILAANHLSPFDPIALAAACRTRRIAPRFLATGGLFRARLLGPVMRHW